MLPKMILVRQIQPLSDPIGDVASAVRGAAEAISFDASALAGKRVGITAGSRGIDRIPEVMRAVVDYVRAAGGEPEIFAAMGSHGDGTAEGQREMLASLGIDERACGAPVLTCAETELCGTAPSGMPVWANALAKNFDAIVLVNRVKMHTDFEGPTESGLLKILAIGVGGPRGCEQVHSHALRLGYSAAIGQAAAVMIDRLPIVLGFMLTENWAHRLDRIEAVRPEDIVARETALLAAVKAQNVKLPVDELDALLIGEIGKNISGTGMDTKVVGRIRIIGQAEPERPRIKRISVLDLSEASHGNAIGIGLADLSTVGVLKKINIHATSLNAVSSMAPEQGSLPCFVDTDRELVEASVGTIGLEDTSQAHVIYIQDTNHLEHIAVSLPLYEQRLKGSPDIELIGEPFDLRFDESGRLLDRWAGGRLS